MTKKIKLTDQQRESLEKLWFIYGNDGPKFTKANHGYIQGFLEYGEDREQFYLDGAEAIKERHLPLEKWIITQECIDEVKKILHKQNTCDDHFI